MTQLREEVYFTKGRVIVRGKTVMAMVDQLEVQLAASRAAAANLLTAVVGELTNSTQSA